MRLSWIAVVAMMACRHTVPTAPITHGDDPAPIAGQYIAETLNGHSLPLHNAVPATPTVDSTTIERATLWLYADGTYNLTTYRYEYSGTITNGIPTNAGGQFLWSQGVLTFHGTLGIAPVSATGDHTGFRVVQSVRAGFVDTLTYRHQPTLPGRTEP